MPNLHKVLLKTSNETAFVRMSADWSLVLVKGRRMTLLFSFSLIKCRSISTCFVRSCWTRFSEMLIAALLSQYRRLACVWWKPSSPRSFLIHRISVTPFAIPMNSASALERATTFCFLLFQVTWLPPTRVKYPEVDFLSSRSPAQWSSRSEHPVQYNFQRLKSQYSLSPWLTD